MFKKRIFQIFLVLCITLGMLLMSWQTFPGYYLKSTSTFTSAARWELELGGQWKLYPSLQQAFVTESKKEINPNPSLTKGKTGYLPSSNGIKVAAKAFQVPSDWHARSLLLQLNGIYGECTVYLNGVESENRLGSIASEGGSGRIQIPVNFLNHGEENLLFLEFDSPLSQRNILFGSKFPREGKLTGSISLQGVMETSIENPSVQVEWEGEKAQVQIAWQLRHHQFSEYGPWSIQVVISDGSAEIAQASTMIQGVESPVQDVRLNLEIPEGKPWSPEDPYLYQVYLTVTNQHGDRDDLAFPLGLPILKFKEGQFFLQEEPFSIKGVALNPEEEEKLRHEGNVGDWLQEQKNKGYNLVYFLGIYPDETWLGEADKIGMGIWVELPGSAMVPEEKLPIPTIWKELFRGGTIHPSLWAYTSGVGLELNSSGAGEKYREKVQELSPLPVFNFPLTSGNSYAGSWGIIEQPDQTSPSKNLWPQEEWVRIVWAVFLFLVALANLFSKSWGYKELQNKKPKRPLRRAWFWQETALLTREMTLAALFTTLIFNTEIPWAQWLPQQWPLWELIRLQSPWLIWLLLGCFFTLGRLLQVGVAAPGMPNSPETLGLAVWLERRFFWNWLVGVLWALRGWGIPLFIPFAVYGFFNFFFLPWKIRDVRRVGGSYRAFLWVPGIIFLAILLMIGLYWSDFQYFFKIILQMDWLGEVLVWEELMEKLKFLQK
ncbi:MAG: beta-galactosidase [Desulfitobacterium sp.]|nr:beta-galactosidase [Desulfitobacterium sp.]